ncbi:C4AC3 protein, partial [Acromyrmex charruanus]
KDCTSSFIPMLISNRHFKIVHCVVHVLGTMWQSQRKTLTPTFHFNILQRFVEIFDKESKNMVKSLKNAKGAVVKDLSSFISEYTLNGICGNYKIILNFLNIK